MWAASVGPRRSEIAALSIAISVDARRSSMRSLAVAVIRKYSFASIMPYHRAAPLPAPRASAPGERRLELAGARRLDVIGRLRRGARDSREQCGSQEDCQCGRTLHVLCPPSLSCSSRSGAGAGDVPDSNSMKSLRTRIRRSRARVPSRNAGFTVKPGAERGRAPARRFRSGTAFRSGTRGCRFLLIRRGPSRGMRFAVQRRLNWRS